MGSHHLLGECTDLAINILSELTVFKSNSEIHSFFHNFFI